ncbi:MAG TPA: glycosyltransferase family 87 protein [Anaerolineae bacterium]|nr:glycosyltransferase family 87 protein [Anaerolineae bacterium]
MRAALNGLTIPELSVGRWLLMLLLAAALVTAVLTLDLWIVDRMERFKAGDFFQFWAAGRTILQRNDPYDPLGWRQIYEQEGRWRWQTDQRVFLYPLWTAFPFVPLAFLPFSTAGLLWALTSQVLLVLSVALWAQALAFTDHRAWLLRVLVLAIAFEPVSLTILFGHVGLVLLFLLSGTLYLVHKGWYAPAGVLLGLTLLKPQLFLLLIPALLVVMLLRRRWSLLASFAITSVALFVTSWLLVPNWVAEWQGYVAQSAMVRLRISPTIWGLSHSVAVAFGRTDLWPGLGVGVLAALLGGLAYLLYVHRQVLVQAGSLEPVLSLVLIASLLIAPYMLSYDFVLLLLPISTGLWIAQHLTKTIRITLAMSLIGCGIILPWAVLADSARTGQETIAALVPCSLLVILVACVVACSRQQRRQPPPKQTGCLHLDETLGGTVCPL